MMMIKEVFLLFLFISFAGACFSQEDDFGIWLGVNVKHEVVKNLDVEFSGCVRTFNNTSQIEQSFLEGGIHYRFNKYFSGAGSYRLISTLEDDSKYYFRHKLFLDITGSIPSRNFDFSGRLRFQRTTRSYIEDEEDLLAKYYGRFKLKVKYNTPSLPLNPYLYYEAFSPISSGSEFEISKKRFSVGTELRITGRSSIDLGYIFQRDCKPHISDIHIILLYYKLKF
jgi:hypothetical protein